MSLSRVSGIFKLSEYAVQFLLNALDCIVPLAVGLRGFFLVIKIVH